MNTKDKISLYLLLIIPLIGGVNNLGNDTMYLRYIRLFFIVFVIFLVIVNHESHVFKIPSFKKYFFYYFYLFICFFSILWGVRKIFAIFKLSEVIIYFILLWNISKRNSYLVNYLFKFIEFLLLVTLITALINPTDGFNIIPNILPYQLRGSYFPLNPNDVGFLACIASCNISWELIKNRKFKFHKLLFFIFILLLSQSRIFIVIYFLFPTLMLTSKKQKIGLLLLTPFIIGKIYDSILPFFLRDKSIEDLSSINGRVDFWEIGINSFMENPWFGKGFYTGHRFLNEIKNIDFNSSTFDNTYIDILNDNGIFGFIPLFIFIFIIAKKLYKLHKLLFSIWLIIIIRAFVGPSFQVIHPVLPIFSVLSIYAFEYKKNKYV